MTKIPEDIDIDIDLHEYWRQVFLDLLHWYSQADSKSTGIIQIDGILLSFITLGAFLGQSGYEKLVQNPATALLLIFFLISVMSSVLLALSALWARIDFDQSILPLWFRRKKNLMIFFNYIAYLRSRQKKNNPLQEEEESLKKKYPKTFFHYIAKKYPANEDNLSIVGRNYFKDQINTYKEDNQLLMAIAVEITILSSDISRKYQLINLSFISAAVALALMSSIVVILVLSAVWP